MSDAVGSAVARKVALDLARAALRSGARSQMEAALAGLPEKGKKANALRSRLRESLAGLDLRPTELPATPAVTATCVSDGIGYEFLVAETGDVAFFVASREAGIVTVTINSAHPFGQLLITRGERPDPAVFALLAAWAHYELDQSDVRRQSVVQDARVDWGRVVRRLLSNGTKFRLG